MKLISPVDGGAEAQALLDAGADELYGGYLSPAWRKRFGSLASPNQRTFEAAQIQTVEEFAEICALARSRGKTMALCLNAPFYTDEQIPLLLDQVDEAARAGVSGIILADAGLLRLLKARHPGLELQASTLAHLGNSAAVRFYARLGIARTILPRHLPVNEMAAIVRAVPGMAFDAFLLVGKCPNTEGLCTFSHDSPDRIWPCEIPYRIEALKPPASASLDAAMAAQGSWSRTNRRHGCGLCAIPELVRSGIKGLKLVGRGAATLQKVRNLQLAGDFLRLAALEPDPVKYRSKARAAHRERFASACSPNVCYYPEFYRGE